MLKASIAKPPRHPEVVCYSDGRETPEQSAAKVIAKLEQLGYLERPMLMPVGDDALVYTEDEEEAVTERLRDLGYL